MQNYLKQSVYTTLFCFHLKFNIYAEPVKEAWKYTNH